MVKSRYGQVTRPAPALVDEATWEGAQEALLRNRKLSKKNAKNTYLLRGLITCSGCGRTYTGATKTRTNGERIASTAAPASAETTRRQGGQKCPAKMLSADWLEDAIWESAAASSTTPAKLWRRHDASCCERMTEATGFEDLAACLADAVRRRKRPSASEC